MYLPPLSATCTEGFLDRAFFQQLTVCLCFVFARNHGDTYVLHIIKDPLYTAYKKLVILNY